MSGLTKFFLVLIVINFLTIAVYPNPGSFVGLVASLVGLHLEVSNR